MISGLRKPIPDHRWISLPDRRIPVPPNKRLPKREHLVTVCIASACEQGRIVVAATDGAMTLGEITADTQMPKMIWLGDWLFMYAGEPSNADLFLDDLRPITLSRANIKTIVHNAYRKRRAHWASDEVLGAFDTDIDEFMATGRNTFGTYYSTLARQISEQAKYFSDQLLVVGWGKADSSVMIHEENKGGSVSHVFPGFAAIGSGGPIAASQLMLLNQARHSSLTDTLYSVAAAKFSAEVASGVGRNTTIWIAWKRRDTEPLDKLAGTFVQPEEIDVLRLLWEQFGRPKIPPHGFRDVSTVLKKSGIDFEHSKGSAMDYVAYLVNSRSGEKSGDG
jgi:ATP-dependent protease HslVU (ClpYQ) peptidase subunit